MLARPAARMSMLEAVGMNEINKIFAVTDAMGVHRESVVDAETPIDEWLKGLPELIRAALSR